MKKLTTSVLLCFAMHIYGQSIVKFSIDSGGASAINGNLQILYTIGEVNLQEYSVSNNQVSEGFIDYSIFKSLGTYSKTSSDHQINIFPNPASEYLNIKTNVFIDYIEMYNILGSKVLKTNDLQIRISNLQSGLYLLKVYSKDCQFSQKIIIE